MSGSRPPDNHHSGVIPEHVIHEDETDVREGGDDLEGVTAAPYRRSGRRLTGIAREAALHYRVESRVKAGVNENGVFLVGDVRSAL